MNIHTLFDTAQPPRWARVKPPPRLSRRALSKAGALAPAQLARASARPWLTPRARRELSSDLARVGPGPALRRLAKLDRPTRAERRAIGAGPWPRLRRRAEKARAARG